MSASLWITIQGTAYRVALASGSLNVRLTKTNGVAYDVAGEQGGAQCSCPDYTYREQARKDACKHIVGLREVGLLGKPQTGS